MTVIIDYGVGNLFSISSSLKKIGEKAVITSDPQLIIKSDRMILPGVGAFEDAALKLKKTGIGELIVNEAGKGKPLLGICLGMQLLFEKSYEFGIHNGLGLIKGEVVAMNGKINSSLKIPHIGWNSLSFKNQSNLFKYIRNHDFVYFVHSFYAEKCDNNVIATTEYGTDLTAAVQSNNIYGCQFHPEKSGEVGLNILRAFLETEKI